VLGTLSTQNTTQLGGQQQSTKSGTENATVRCAKADVDGDLYNALCKKFPAFSKNIGIHVGSVGDDIHTPPPQTYDRKCVFVLPSQLNAAEYGSAKKTSIVKEVTRYKWDITGGPIGQLAADPGAAQFIIHNAMHSGRPEKQPYNDANPVNYDFINYISDMGPHQGIKLINGYLKVTENLVNIPEFEKNLKHMNVLGMSDLAVCGTLVKAGNHFLHTAKQHKVDLIYASAVPLVQHERYCNNTKEKDTLRIAELTIFAQYTAALRIAIECGDRHVYLLPLGGGEFENDFNSIARAMNAAFRHLETELYRANCEVSVLAFKFPPPHRMDEPAFFQNAHDGTPISGACSPRTEVLRTRAENEQAPWPLTKFREPRGDNHDCFLLATGAMNPVHLGHVAMLHAAAKRLTEEGYNVCGAYLSPSHDKYVQRKPLSLSAAFRLKVAHRAVADDPLVAVSSWEIQETSENYEQGYPDFPDVCAAAAADSSLEQFGQVFYVCGTDHLQHVGGSTDRDFSVVAVPRSASEHVPDENIGEGIYVATPHKDVRELSSTELRKAIAEKDYIAANKMVSPAVVQILINPTEEEGKLYITDFEKLRKPLSS
jgi:hypothetical protein